MIFTGKMNIILEIGSNDIIQMIIIDDAANFYFNR